MEIRDKLVNLYLAVDPSPLNKFNLEAILDYLSAKKELDYMKLATCLSYLKWMIEIDIHQYELLIRHTVDRLEYIYNTAGILTSIYKTLDVESIQYSLG